MKFNIVKEEAYSFDFVMENLENTLACFESRHYPQRIGFESAISDQKNSIKRLFESSGLITSNSRVGFHYKLSSFWEGFAEFILQKDFKFYKKEYRLNNVETNTEFSENSIVIDLFNKEIDELESRLRDKEQNILCDILKQKYEFMHKPHEIVSIQIIEKRAIEFYTIPFKEFVFLIPKNEIDNVRREWKLKETPPIPHWITEDLQKFQELTPTTIGTKTLTLSTSFLLISLLSPDERTEYDRKGIEAQEYTELKIKRAEYQSNSYKFVLEKNNITLSADDSQALVECFIIHFEALDLFGIKRPTASSCFSKPFYFIEVKSTNKKYNTRLSALQEKFVEKAKDKLGILILHIKIKPDEAAVRFLLPK